MAARLIVGAEQSGDAGGQQHGGRGRGLEEGVVVGKLEHLVVGGAGQFLAAIAHLDAPQAGHGVEQPVPLAIEDPAAVGAGDDAAAAGRAHLAVVLLGRQVMGDVQSAKFGDVVVFQGHGLSKDI